MGKHPPIAAPQPVSFNIPVASKTISSNSVSNINRLAATTSKSKSRFGKLEVPKLSIPSALTNWLGGKSSNSSKNEKFSTKDSTKGSFLSKRKKEKRVQEDDDLPDIPLPAAPKSPEEPAARVVKKEQTAEGGAQVQNKIGSIWRDQLLRTAKKNLGKRLKPRVEEEETRKPEALPTTRTIKNHKEGVIFYEEDEKAGSSIPNKFPSKRPNDIDLTNSAKRRDISGLFSLEEDELSNIPYPPPPSEQYLKVVNHFSKQSEDICLHPRISFSGRKELEDELPNDVVSLSSEKFEAKDSSESSPKSMSFTTVRSTPIKPEKQSNGGIHGKIKQEVDVVNAEGRSCKQSCSDHKGRKVSKRERQKSCTSTTNVSEKKRKKQKEKTPPNPKKQEVTQLLSPKLSYSAGKPVKRQIVMSPSTPYPSAAILDNGKFGQSANSSAIFSPPGLLNKLDISFASGYGSNYSYGSPSVPEIKVAERIRAVNGQFLTCFFTKIYCFSNHFFKRDLMKIDGVNYICVEQYYMYYKAKVFGDMQAANKCISIMLANTPASMKKVGSNITNFNQNVWRPIAMQVMVIGALRKFEQNPDLRQHLFDTSGSILVEASPSDKFWGVGLSMKSPAIRDMANWPGQNVLGKTLTMVREKLLRRDEFKTERRVF